MKGEIKMVNEHAYCPVCGEDMPIEDIRYQMCLDCFADTIMQDVTEDILYDFLRDYGREFRMYIADNYAY